jgi:hypothetical protein
MNRTLLAPLLLVLAVGGCASSGGTEQRTTGIYEYTLTREDFSNAAYANMLDVVNALRGNWLQNSLVAVDGLLIGDTSELRRIHPMNVESVRLLNVHQAKTMFGMQMNFRRAIVVTSKRGGNGGTAAATRGTNDR